MLKLQHPGSAAACHDARPGLRPRRATGCCSAVAPTQTRSSARSRTACAAGASGFIVGRTLFDGALVADRAAADRALVETSTAAARTPRGRRPAARARRGGSGSARSAHRPPAGTPT
ncbi:MAG: hypothetical protein WKG07_36175 [Hymenobacter sp.]